MLRPLLLAAGFALTVSTAGADEVSDKQKADTLAALKKADVTNTTFAETANVMVFATLPEEKTKALAAALQKAHAAAARPLQYDDKDTPWKGKLGVVYLTDKKLFTLFVRSAASDRPDGNTYSMLRGDTPWIAVAREVGPKTTDAELAAEASDLIIGSLLTARAGTGTVLPDWLRGGFVRAAALRAGGPMSPRMTAYKTKARAFVPRTLLAGVWDGSIPDAEVQATALVDFLAYGPKAADFPRVLTSFKPNENGNAPAAKDALEAAGWKLPELDAAWKKWVAAGLIEAKPKP